MCLLTLTLALPLHAATWYVNDTSTVGDVYTTAVGNDSNAGNISDSPFRTITHALSVAVAYDTIYIDAGTYLESVTIETDGIGLIGADSQSTIIDPPGSGFYSYNGIDADTQVNLKVEKIKITDGNTGIDFYNIDSSVIRNVQSYSNDQDGFSLRESDNNILKNNISEKNLFNGFYFLNSDSNLLSNCVADSNGTNGIDLFYSSANLLNNNLSLNNLEGYKIFYSTNNTISGNLANNNIYSGFMIYGDSVSFDQNIDDNNYINALPVKYLKNISNQIIDNWNVGALIIFKGDSLIIKNMNVEHGGVYLGAVNNSIIENNIVKFGGGFAFGGIESDTIRNNKSVNNSGGFFVHCSNNNTLKNNESDSDAGFFLYSSSNNNLGNNKCLFDNAGFAIVLSDSNIIARNFIYNSVTGITLYSSSNNEIFNNTAIFNSTGISFNKSTNNFIENNIIVRNYWGIYTNSSLNNVLKYNNIWNNSSADCYNCASGLGSISADPLFLSVDPNDTYFLHLSSNSPCIDAGDPSDPVPAGGGARIDMGAIEYIYGTIYLQEDTNTQNEYKMYNYPNPFKIGSEYTKIRYYAPSSVSANQVEVAIYNLAGEQVWNTVADIEAGKYKVTVWYGRNNAGKYIAPGVYFAVLKIEGKNALVCKIAAVK